MREFKAAGNTTECMRVLEDHGIIANIRQYYRDPVISAMSRHGDWREALELLSLKETVLRGLWTTPSRSALISACDSAKGGKWERALELAREIKRKGTVADTITYNALISACDKGGKWEQALELAGRWKAMGLWPTPSR